MNGRALNDFETAENNELALRAGEVIVVSDFSRVNWRRVINHRGEKLFTTTSICIIPFVSCLSVLTALPSG